MKPQKKIILASPRGFCAGVHRAIEVVDISIELFGTPLYVHHQIVHNRHVVDDFIAKGVRFVESIDDVPDNSPVIFSAHGVSPEIRRIAAKKNLKIIDATCPLVTKVHNEAYRYAQNGYEILLIGHKNHVETIGTFGEAPDKIHIIENIQDIDALNFSTDAKLAYLTQTTLSVHDTREMIQRLVEKYPGIKAPGSSDICYATTNRQEAAGSIADMVDIVLVIGSQNSSNSNRLKELVEKIGKPTHLIDNAGNIKPEWIHERISVIGITAGASAPEELVDGVLTRLKEEFDYTEVEEITVKEENIVFQLPVELLQTR
jgi:4-hydroxy-3-methylbut-2-enyl diphosphate reductase